MDSPGIYVAVDKGLDVHLDPVLHAGARSAESHSGATAGADGCRTGEHEGVNHLGGGGRKPEAASRRHAGVHDIRPYRCRVWGQADQFPQILAGVVLGLQVVDIFTFVRLRFHQRFRTHVLVHVPGADTVGDLNLLALGNGRRVLVGGVVIHRRCIRVPADVVSGQGHTDGGAHSGSAPGGDGQ